MTRSDAQEAQYTRKLALAILSTLQQKGLLSAGEVDAILVAARRSADEATRQPAPAPTQDFTKVWAQRRPVTNTPPTPSVQARGPEGAPKPVEPPADVPLLDIKL